MGRKASPKNILYKYLSKPRNVRKPMLLISRLQLVQRADGRLGARPAARIILTMAYSVTWAEIDKNVVAVLVLMLLQFQ